MGYIKSALTALMIFSFVFMRPSWASQALNNKYGISLLQPSQTDIKNTAELVNSQGGDYGYVTLVIQEDDRDKSKWQDIFDELRKHHLVPIVRLATKPEGENWKKPTKDEAIGWADFLNSLNWVVKNRYIVLFNEPNHATEWGGEVNPQDYAQVAFEFAKVLKQTNREFFIMLAGFDASAPHYPNQYEDEEIFLQGIFQDSDLKIQDYIDGWATHSYPNPGFSGSPWDTGRKSIRGYEWELGLLERLGVLKEMPVFITETGWVDTKLSRETVASYYRVAFEQIWGPDTRIVAVTPFVFSYQSAPFSGFSWKKIGGDEFYPQYGEVLGISKVRGSVEQIESGVLSMQLPLELVANSNYQFSMKLKNTGQAIWDEKDGYKMSIIDNDSLPFEYIFSDIKGVEPYREINVILYLKTHKIEGQRRVQLALIKDNEAIIKSKVWKFAVLPIPKLEIKASLFPKIEQRGSGFEVQIFDEDEKLVYKKKGLELRSKTVTIDEVQNVALGKKYRVVLLKKNYLPRQAYITFRKDNNILKLKQMLPFDLSNDGSLGFDDLGAFFKDLSQTKLLIP